MKNEHPYTISVVLACYRGEKYLARQLKSLVDQSMKPDEILLCDDSPDDLCCRIARDFAGVRILKNDPPLGVAANFARGIAEAQGELIFLADQDDVWHPEKICKMVQALGDHAGVFCNSSLTDENLQPLGVDHWSLRGFPAGELRELRSGPAAKRMQELFCRRVLPAGHDMMFRASCRERILPMPELKACHDSWIGIAVTYCGSWAVCDEELTLFRQHRNNLSGMGRRSPWQEARQSVKDNTFSWNAALYQEAYNRFGDEKLFRRAEHSAARAGMNIPLWKRLPLVFKEWRSGNYRRFGRGWQNVVQDLFFR
jgi:glycosyltransferase involved in cell wall biosynthesis